MSSLDIPSDDSDTLDIAQSMGFSSFGNKPHKKRKFNPKTDAAVDTTTNTIIAGSGGNSIPLGRRKARGIGTEEVEEVGGGGVGGIKEVGGGMDGILEDGVEGVEGEEEDPGYVDDTPPPVNPEIEEGRDKEAQTQASPSTESVKPEGGVHIPQSISSTANPLPPKPLFPLLPSSSSTQQPQSTQPITQSTTPIRTDMMGRDEAQQLRRGVRDRNGDIAYYDPSFIEDPWARFEVPTSSLPPQ